ncbi:MAG: 4Fe-4S dicluster domain-containing protein [Anaerolineae bacterium]|nr:MAG: 4Fe-4S dicluster domain-containing protein [Anaerolineae bacterium]
MPKYGMVIDLSRCTGCRACMVACKVENNTPQENFWMHVFRFEDGTYPDTRVRFMPRPCMHCENPPCVDACPTGARFTREDGLVATDFETCIGSRYCQAACPYGVNYFNFDEPSGRYYLDWDNTVVPPYANPSLDVPYGEEQLKVAGGGKARGVIEKCTFCVHRVEDGRLPACAAVCPTNAIHFGDLDDPNSEVSKLLAESESFRLMHRFGTKPKVHYINGKAPRTGMVEIEQVGGY